MSDTDVLRSSDFVGTMTLSHNGSDWHGTFGDLVRAMFTDLLTDGPVQARLHLVGAPHGSEGTVALVTGVGGYGPGGTWVVMVDGVPGRRFISIDDIEEVQV